MRRLILAGVIGAFVMPSLAWAAGAGNPASNVGRENYGFTLEVEEQQKRLDNDLARSRRYLGKVIWGVTDKLDLYAKLGSSDLRVDVEDDPDFRGSQGMTWGGGIRYVVAEVKEPQILAFVDVQALSYFSKGTVLVPRSFGDDIWTDKHSDRYKWNEVQFSLCAAWEHSRFIPYIGFSLTNVFGRVERDLYRISWGDEEFQQSEANDFREDGIPELIMGMDVDIGGTGSLSGEIRWGDENDISFFIGLSELIR